MKRRHFLALTSATGIAAVAPVRLAGASEPAPPEGYFQHSVASGDPLPDAVIIWTRLTPTVEALPGSGVGPEAEVEWEVATDAEFSRIVTRGRAHTSAERDHTVTVDVTGLQPASTYFYRFAYAGQYSRTGRTRTAPAAGAMDPVRFAVCSCSNYEAGYFRGYRHIAERSDIEFVLHLGDYTYEYESGGYTGAYGTVVRPVQPPHRTRSVRDFRIRQGHYKKDPDLADLHARLPMICIWDDHEFSDNAYKDGQGGGAPEFGADYQRLRRNGMQAYYEWMPVRTQQGRETIYRSFSYGGLFDLIVPDLRTFRDAALVHFGDNKRDSDPLFWVHANDEERTMLGREQFEWFTDRLANSTARWQVVGNEVMIAPMTLPAAIDPQLRTFLQQQVGLPEDGVALNTDQWDGFMAERQRIVDTIVGAGGRNVLFLTGDIHSSWANDVPLHPQRYRDGDRRVAATEFVTTSITAAGAYDALSQKIPQHEVVKNMMRVGEHALTAINPWFKRIDCSRHGYMAVEITPDYAHADWVLGDSVLEPDAPLWVEMSYRTYAGNPGAQPHPQPLA
ncbi:alkaline phosphatase D family protein [Corynebacterium ciconiae]|uniref:alkaline phosphatase D family protein n=1 Tax=Corynebacterium ciconiae TaxID=227319 RepID=UPI00142ECD5A|nr:alkaline phosphatase D family protein [Corynebacterium ciconiae]